MTTSLPAVRAALHAAWTGADPGPTVPELRPSPRRHWPGPVWTLERRPTGDFGGLLDLALADDPRRKIGGVRLRRVPSAGGRYPVEAHVVADGVAWRYDPLAHALAAPSSAPTTSGVTIVLSLNPVRTWWRYGARSLPVLLLDLGHAVASVLVAAAVTGRAAYAELGRPAVELAELAALPWHEGAARWPGCAPEYPLVAVMIQASLGLTGKLAGACTPLPERALDDGTRGREDTGNLILTALAELAEAATEPVRRTVPRLDLDAGVLVTRHSAEWPAVCAGSVAPSDRRKLAAGAGPAALLVDPALVAGLAERACGQPEIGRASAALLFIGDPTPCPLTVYVDAGITAHLAWLTATRLGLPTRPVGCWIDAEVHRGRLLHALAIGGR